MTTTGALPHHVATSLTALLLEHPADTDAAVLHTPDSSLTLRELRDASSRVAEALTSCSVEPGSPVVCIVDNGASALATMFGTWMVGAVYVPLNARAPDVELAAALTALEPAAVVGRQRSLQTSCLWLHEAEPLEWTPTGSATGWSGETLPNDTALLVRTSGTTGAAKTVSLSHTGVLDGIDRVLDALRGGRSGGSRMPNLVPTSQALWAGLWNTLFALRAGAPLVLLDRFEPAVYADLVRRFEIRSTVLAPAMMAMLVADDSVTDLTPLRMVRSITAPLTPQQARAFHAKFGVGVMNCYGQTELGSEVVGWTAADLREHGDSKLGAVGRAHPGVALKVLDSDGTDVAAGEVGELWVAAPSASTSSEVASRLVDGYLQTGDLARIDEDGFVWLDGRLSDMINRGGLKVQPQEVEDVFRDLPGVADVCVAGAPDDRLGEVPVAWVVPRPGATLDGDALLAAARAALTAYKVPVALHVRSELPRNEIGKVLRRSLVNELTKDKT